MTHGVAEVHEAAFRKEDDALAGRELDLIDLRLFRAPAFSAAIATNVLGFCVIFAIFLFIAQYLQSVLDLSPLQAGLWGVPSALAFVAGSIATPAIVRRVRPAYVIAGGMAVFFVNVVWSLLAGRRVPDNPWGEGATTLEWTLSSPPPFHQFEILPKVG